MLRTHTNWAKALIFRPREILGTVMEPFSLGHYIILTYIESPFIFGGNVDPGDLYVAVEICSRKYKESERMLLWKDWESMILKKIVEKGITSDEFDAAKDLFIHYLVEAIEPPDYITSAGKEKSQAGAPWPQQMRCSLQKNLGLSESEILDQWLKKSQYDWFSLLEQEDPKKFRLKNESDIDADEMPHLTQEEIRECLSMNLSIPEYIEKKKNGN
jgi:hypothetical protein